MGKVAASKSIYPVIGVHCNPKGVSFPSEETIAILSWRTPKTVRTGIKGLLHYPGFHVERYVTNRGHRANKYKLDAPPDEKGRSFAFYKCVVTGGNWSQLTPGAHALYPVMMTFSFFDFENYEYLENTEFGDNVQDMIECGYYQRRKYDFCDADIKVMAEFAGIGKSTVVSALISLEQAFLVEKIEPINKNDTWKVFRSPPRRYQTNWLNEKTFKRYGKPF
jgi:hypothetical protein